MALRTANNLKKLVALPVGVSDTTIQLTDTSGLPDVSDPNDYTMLTLIQAGTLLYEIVRVDSVSANVITVVRAQEGTVALNFSPSDEVRNWLTSGMFDKTVKAEATLNSNSLLVAGGDTDVSTPSTPTAVTHEGSLDLLGTAGEDTLLEIGKGRTGDGAAIVDLIGDPTNTDYGARLIRNKGVNGDTELFSKGIGKISLNAEDAGSIELKTNDTLAMSIDASQNAIHTGTVDLENTLNINATSTEPANIEVGKGRSGDGDSFIDLVSDATNADYGARLLKGSGVDSFTELKSKGTSGIAVVAEDAGNVILKTNNTDALTIDSSQNATFKGNVTVEGVLNTSGSTRIWNAVDNGVDNTGVADAGAQLNTLIGLAAEGDTIYLPAGTYNISTEIAFSGKIISVKGAGINATTLLVSSTNGLTFNPDDSSNPEFLELRGFTLKASGAVASGIIIDGTNAIPERNSPRLLISDIEFNAEGVSDEFTNHALLLDDVLHGNIQRVHGKGYWSGTSASITSGNMIRIQGLNSPVEFTIADSYCFFFNNAISIADNAEGVLVSKCHFVAVNYGVNWNTLTVKPHLNVSNSHINAYINCVRMVNCHQSVITGNLFYRREESTTSGDACVYMFNGYNNLIHGNTFNDVNPTVGDSTAIELAAVCNNNNITNNRAMDDIHNGLIVDVSSQNNQAIDNDFSNVVTAPYINASPSLVICDNITDKRNIYAEMVIKGLSNGTRVLDFETDTGVTDRNARIAAIGGDTNIDSASMHFYASEYIMESGALNLQPITAPSNPSSGFYIYVDSADGDLKVKSSTGVTTTLANN